MKKIIGTLSFLVVIVLLIYVLIGGKPGALLLYVKWFQHKEAAPTQVVSWQQGIAPHSHVTPPNIIVIAADDLGGNDLTLNGGGVAGALVPTPNINSIAQNGVQFTAGYAGNATCSPSRAAMMMGRYPSRFGFEFTSVPIAFARNIAEFKNTGLLHPIYHAEREAQMPAYESQGVPTDQISIARWLKQVNYHSIHIGKWHLGESAAMSPIAHGFDESLSFLQGAMMFAEEDHPDIVNAKQDFDPIDKFLWVAAPFAVSYNNGTPFKPASYVTNYFTDQTIAAIEANKNRPFFIYLAYNAPHTPLQAMREDYAALSGIQDHTRRVYAAMIRNLDRNVGRILETLKAQGLYQNTLIVFTSDNGGANYIGLDYLNKPYRGWKATFFEGGIRVPFFMQWPAAVPSGVVLDAPVSHFDIFATAAGAAGLGVPQDRVMDGVNLLPYIQGTQQGAPHERLFWRSGEYQAVREGDWKLQVNHTQSKIWLFNLENDPTEQNNLAAQYPEQVEILQGRLAAFNQEQPALLWPSLLEVPVLIDKPMNRPQSPSDEFIYWSN